MTLNQKHVINDVFSSNFPAIHVANKSDKELISNILTEAFSNDPCIGWLTAPCKKTNKIRTMVDYTIDEAFSNGHVFVEDNLKGATLWLTEQKENLSFRLLKRNFRYWAKNGTASSLRALKLKRLSHQNFPKKRNYIYLMMVGVKKNAQGEGIGSKLLRPILSAAKKVNIPVFLDTCNLTNVSIYQKMGFKIINTYNTRENTEIKFMKFD